MGLYTVLKPYLKGENTNITKTNLKLKDFQNIYFKKLKIFSGEISLNNMCSDLAVKWLSLISIKSEQVSKLVLYAQSTGAVISGRYTSHVIYLIFINVYVLKSVYIQF